MTSLRAALAMVLCLGGFAASTASSHAADTNVSWVGSLEYTRVLDQMSPAVCQTGSGFWRVQLDEHWTVSLPQTQTVAGDGVTVALDAAISGSYHMVSTRVCNGEEQERQSVVAEGEGFIVLKITQDSAAGDAVTLGTEPWSGIPGTLTYGSGGTSEIGYYPVIVATTTEGPAGSGVFVGSVPAWVGVDDMQRYYFVDGISAFDPETETMLVNLRRSNSKIATSIVTSLNSSGSCGPSGCVAKRYKVFGQIKPAIVASLRIRFQAKRGGSWRTVATKSATSTSLGRYATQFGQTSGTQCRVQVAFGGTATHAASARTITFGC